MGTNVVTRTFVLETTAHTKNVGGNCRCVVMLCLLITPKQQRARQRFQTKGGGRNFNSTNVSARADNKLVETRQRGLCFAVCKVCSCAHAKPLPMLARYRQAGKTTRHLRYRHFCHTTTIVFHIIVQWTQPWYSGIER